MKKVVIEDALKHKEANKIYKYLKPDSVKNINNLGKHNI